MSTSFTIPQIDIMSLFEIQMEQEQKDDEIWIQLREFYLEDEWKRNHEIEKKQKDDEENAQAWDIWLIYKDVIQDAAYSSLDKGFACDLDSESEDTLIKWAGFCSRVCL